MLRGKGRGGMRQGEVGCGQGLGRLGLGLALPWPHHLLLLVAARVEGRLAALDPKPSPIRIRHGPFLGLISCPWWDAWLVGVAS